MPGLGVGGAVEIALDFAPVKPELENAETPIAYEISEP
jgi:hypothetical protein